MSKSAEYNSLRNCWYDGRYKFHNFRKYKSVFFYKELPSFTGTNFLLYQNTTSYISVASFASQVSSFEKRKEQLEQGESCRIPWLMEFEKNKPSRLDDAIRTVEHLITTYGIHPEDVIIWITPGGSIYVAVNPRLYHCIGEADELCKRNKNITLSLIRQLSLQSVDTSIYDPQRIIRTWNSTYHNKKRGFVVPITYFDLYQLQGRFHEYTYNQVDLKSIILPCQEAPDWVSFVEACTYNHIAEAPQMSPCMTRNCMEYFMQHPEKVQEGIRNQMIVSMSIYAREKGEDVKTAVYAIARKFEGYLSSQEILSPIRSVERHETKFSCEKAKGYLEQQGVDLPSLCASCPFANFEQKRELKEFMIYGQHAEIMYEQKWPIEDIELYFDMSREGYFRQKKSLDKLDQYTKMKYKRIIHNLALTIDNDGFIVFNRKRGYKVPTLFYHVAKVMGGVRLRQFLLLLTKSYRQARGGYLTRLSKAGIQKLFGLKERALYYLLEDFRERGLFTMFTNTIKITFGISKIKEFAKPEKLQLAFSFDERKDIAISRKNGISAAPGAS